MSPRRALVAVIGDAGIAPGSPTYVLAEELGERVIDSGFRLLTGGLGGVMEAASRGAHRSAAYHDGDVVGLLPGRDPDDANEFVDIAIPTGLDHARNSVVALADAVIAVGGGAGTLSEMAHAWIERRLIIAMRCDGWSGELADRKIDERLRYPEIPDDRVYGAETPQEATGLLKRLAPQYIRRHRGVRRRTPPSDS
jgi:uncharacterized protein (TIGR00725 family)